MATDESTGTDEVLNQDIDAGQKKPTLSLEVNVDSPSACQRHVTVTIGREDIDRYFNEAITELMPKSNVPGFRPGRAPRKIVESRYRKDMLDQVKNTLLLDTMNQVSEEQGFSAISEPEFDFDAVEVPNEGSMTFEFDIEVRPEFDLPEWKGLKLKRPVRKITKKDVDAQITRMLSRNAQLVPTDGGADEGDYVVVNMEFQHEGNVVSRSEENTLCIRPSLSFRDCLLEGFAKLMKGAKKGDTKQTEATLSDDAANRDLRGEKLTADFHVLEVKKLDLPALHDEQLEQLGGFKAVGDLKDSVEKDLNRRLGYRQRQSIRRQITGVLTESADWELPPELLNRQSQRELERAVLELRASGFDEEAIRTHANDLRRNVMSSTETALKEHFILERIAEDQDVEAEDGDYDDEISLIADQRDESPRRVRARLEKQGAMDALRNQIIERKVLGLIESHAQFEDVKDQDTSDDVQPVDFSVGGVDEESMIPEAKHGPDAGALRQPADHT